MEWSSNVRYARYLRAVAATVPPWTYLIPLAFAVGVSLTFTLDSAPVTRVVVGLAALVLFLGVFFASLLHSVRRSVRGTRTTLVRYRLGADELSVTMGRDVVQLPRDALRLTRATSDFVALRRSGMSGRPALLFFDDPELARRVAAELR